MYDLTIRRDGTLALHEDRLSNLNKWSILNTLRRLKDETPVALTTESHSREAMGHLLQYAEEGDVLLEPLAKDAIEASLDQAETYNAPLREPTDQELVAYADEKGMLTCSESVQEDSIRLTKGKSYDIRTGSTPFTEKFTRKKAYFDEEEGVIKVIEHDCELTGIDRYIRIVDDNGSYQFWRDRPGPHDNQHQEGRLWNHFERPEVKTVKEVSESLYNDNISEMGAFEAMAGFTYYPGQLDYWARMGIKDYGLAAADVGTGKTLGALTLAWLKKAERILIMAPKGTVENEMGEKKDYDPAQWVAEIQKFCPYYPVYTLFSESDYMKVHTMRDSEGNLPAGIYITYPSAFLRNRALEWKPGTWAKKNSLKREEDFRSKTNIKSFKWRKDWGEDDDKYPMMYHDRLGQADANGVQCVAMPSLATICGNEFDMVIIDEAHLMRSRSSIQTRTLLRLQPRYRYALSATPIPNQVTNIFPILGWLAVPDWHLGDQRNAAFPYSMAEYGTFEGQFMSKEFDTTEEYKRKKDDREWNGRIRSNSAIISSPSRLLKLIKPILAYISKEDCNPDVVPCNISDIRVPMGAEQMELYAKYLDRKVFIPKGDKDKKEKQKALLTAALRQTNALRSICCDPAGEFAGMLEKDKDICNSNFNPKIVTILQMIKENLDKDEQTVVVYSRVGQGSEIAKRLNNASVPYGRIDSTVSKHAVTAGLFKKKRFPVLLMGINCAQAYSFENCPNLIVASLDWGYGSLHQALGRVHRLNSPKPCSVYVILFENTVEEAIFDKVATKRDAATLCLHGERVDRDYKQMDASEVLAEHIINFNKDGASRPESECELEWNGFAGQMAESLTSYNYE